jgi:hypothetical protein
MLPTGITLSYFGSTSPDGWLLLNGETIGTPSSGATAKASFDTWPLYNLLWNDTSASVVGGRGNDAASDYEDNKELILPNACGRTLAGADPSGTILTDATALGVVLGAESIQLAMQNIPGHQHGLSATGTFDTNGGGSSSTGVVGSETTSTSETAPSVSHSNVQPTLIANWIIKL